MATFALTDAQIFSAGRDYTGVSNQVSWEVNADELDDTTFGDTARSRKAGLKDFTMSFSGFRDDAVAGYDQDQYVRIIDFLGAQQHLVSTAVEATAGSVAYFGRARQLNYQQNGSIGDLAGFSGQSSGSNGVGAVRGQLLFPKGDVSGAANGSNVTLGAASSSESLYVGIHVFSAGTTCDVIVESDDNGSFTSATTRSSTTVTSAGGTWVTPVSGAITDTLYRVRFANVTGTFSLAVVAGIQ